MLFSYLNAALALIALLSGSSALEVVVFIGGIGAFGIANDRKWGYALCLIASIVFLVAQVLLFFVNPFIFAAMVNLLFSVFLVALLLHPASRIYRRVYFH